MISDRQHGFRGQPLSYNAIERYARSARSAILPDFTVTEPVPGLRLFENLDELEIEADGNVLRSELRR